MSSYIDVSKRPGAPGYVDPAATRALQKTYRSDFGSSMTDSEYNTAQEHKKINEQNQAYQASQSSGGGGAYSSSSQSYGGGSGSSIPPVQASSNSAGSSNITQPAFEQERLQSAQGKIESDFLNQRAKLSEEAFNSRLGAITGLIGNQGQPGTEVQYDAGGDETAARASAFARAKEQSGQTAGAAVKSLQDLYAGQGLSGSTMEAAQIGGQVGGAATNVNDFTREQYIQDLQKAGDIAKTKYEGGIVQRGQNTSMAQALIGLANSGMLY